MEKTLKQKLKNLEECRNRYLKWHSYDQTLSKSIFILMIIFFLVVVPFRYYYNTDGIKVVLLIFRIIGLVLIIFICIIYHIKNKILTQYLVLACDTDIDLSNTLKFYEKNKDIEISSVKVHKNASGKCRVIVELLAFEDYHEYDMDLKEAIGYMVIE